MVAIQTLLIKQKEKVLEEGMAMLQEGAEHIATIQTTILKLIPSHYQAPSFRLLSLMCEQSRNLGKIGQTIEQLKKITINEIQTEEMAQRQNQTETSQEVPIKGHRTNLSCSDEPPTYQRKL